MSNLIKCLLSYLYTLRRFILCSIFSVLTFSFIFYLYKIDPWAVWYPALLSLTGFGAFAIFGFISFYKNHKKLEVLKENPRFLDDNLPIPRTLLETDYTELLQILEATRRHESDKQQSDKNEMSDYYAAWMHQIKTPIAVMQLMLQQEDTPLNGGLSCELFNIEQYVEMALYYIRLGENASDLLIKECALDEIVRKAVRKYAAQFVRKKISLEYNGTCKTIITDEKWLSFIVEQLLSNAIKYTAKGFVKISISDDNILTISDSGIGIAPEDLPRIFEKGFTGYNGRLDKKSTGIGLYLCRTAASKLSHTLSVKSIVGKGSQFSVDLNTYKLIVE